MLRNLARRQSTSALLNEPPENLQASLLRERGEGAYGICRFHISIIVELMEKVKRIAALRGLRAPPGRRRWPPLSS